MLAASVFAPGKAHTVKQRRTLLFLERETTAAARYDGGSYSKGASN
jgi:hypothetical protein